MDDESIDDHIMSDDLGDGSFRIASGMGKHENHLATNILTCSMVAGTSAGHNMAMTDIGGGVGADDADIRHNGHGEEDDSSNGDNSSELTDLNT